MQANEFEKKIQNTMDGFELAPSEEVWEQVSVRIKEEKTGRRRIAIFWMTAAILLVVGISGWWLLKKDIKRDEHIVHSPLKEFPSQKQELVSTKKDTLDEISLPAKNRASGKSILSKTPFASYTAPVAGKPAPSRGNQIATPLINATSGTTANTDLQIDGRRAAEQSTLLPHRFYDPKLSNAKDIEAGVKDLTPKPGRENALESPKAKAGKRQRGKKWSPGFTAYTGISDNLSGLPVLFSSSRYNYSFPADLQTSIGGSNNFNSSLALLNHRSSLSFGLGVFASRSISKRFSFSAGIDYHFYSSKSAIGNKVNTPSTFNDSSLGSSTRVNESYLYGQSETFINKYHYLELPVIVGFRINKNETKPLLISAGIAPGYLLGSRALYANSQQQRYYVEKEQFRRVQLSGQVALSIPVISSDKFFISAGPALHYGIINLSKPETRTNQHLFFTGIKASVSFK